ncbi:VirK protein [Legionella lansingensis]|uniref:VirK protein n=1 Tax=Legionella lansingensis TaxID=45067 RepID=A0A0W0VGB0_9GAMM|nr:VirK family protein [Legionella lansingensis]KTD19153.1 VirK protein [Legionella lansingensis]SNV45437.1 VirK protein [Legionella lansingensis]
MKKLLTLAIVILSFSVHAAELASFADIATAIKNGKQLSFVWAIKECTSEQTLPNSITSVRPNAVMLIADQRITASDRHFTLNDPSLPDTPAFGYSKFNLQANGHATLNITLMRAQDYSKVKTYQIECELGKGLTIFD